MENSKAFLKEHNILPQISFKDGKEHIVVLVKDKSTTITDKTGEQKDGVKYLVTEEGEPKSFITASQTLISKLAEMPEGTMVKIKLGSVKGKDGFISQYKVEEMGKEVSGEEIPIVEDEGTESQPPF